MARAIAANDASGVKRLQRKRRPVQGRCPGRGRDEQNGLDLAALSRRPQPGHKHRRHEGRRFSEVASWENLAAGCASG